VDKDLKKLIREIERNDFSAAPGGKHLKVKNADGNTIATLPTTPGGSLWLPRARSQLKRLGVI